MTLPELEKRMANLEGELASLKARIGDLDSDVPWWEQIAGTFSDDAAYAQAMELGREYRQSLRSADASAGKTS